MQRLLAPLSAALLSAPALLAQVAPPAGPGSPEPLAPPPLAVHVRALIDGRSRLILDDDTASWHHLDYAAPGRHRCDAGAPEEPTLIDGLAWFPLWPDVPDCENRWCDCTSDVVAGLPNTIPDLPAAARLELVDCRDKCRVVEQPGPANGYRVVVEFDDDDVPGSAWYEVVVVLEECDREGYCPATPNSTGLPAQLTLEGSLSVSENAAWLAVEACPPKCFGVFFYGADPALVPVADGFLCVSPFHPGLFRLPPLQVDSGGAALLALDFPSLPPAGQIEAGSTWHFQFWYRDPAAGGAGSNFSDAVRAAFCF